MEKNKFKSLVKIYKDIAKQLKLNGRKMQNLHTGTSHFSFAHETASMRGQKNTEDSGEKSIKKILIDRKVSKTLNVYGGVTN